MLTKDKINDIWQSGYCRNVVIICGRTEPGPAGASERIKAINACYTAGCQDCTNAIITKSMEGDVAQTLGPSATQLFLRGGDITSLPEFRPAFVRRMKQALQQKEISAAYITWVTEKASARIHGYPWYDQDFGGIS